MTRGLVALGRRMLRRASALALACGLFAGCAETGVLELQIMLPPKPAGDTERLFALVQVRRSTDHPFEVDWLGEDGAAIELGEAPILHQTSVIGRDPGVDVHVKVRFCRAPSCDALVDASAPELWMALEHPFYVGRRTAWATCIATVPTARPLQPLAVDRCDIHGCTVGSSSTYCSSDGQHFCETDAIDEPPRDLRCVDGTADY